MPMEINRKDLGTFSAFFERNDTFSTQAIEEVSSSGEWMMASEMTH